MFVDIFKNDKGICTMNKDNLNTGPKIAYIDVVYKDF